MRSKVFVLSFLVLTVICSPSWSATYAEGEALAVFRVHEGVEMSAASVSVSEAVGEIGASVAESYETLSEIEGKFIVLVRSPSMSTEELIATLKARPDVITASPNYHTQPQSFSAARVPNDPSADLCWGLKAINAPEVWEHTAGSHEIYACVVDSGVYKHPDLVDNIAAEYGYNTQTVSGEYDLSFGSWDADFAGHGTHVAGTIGAVGNNGIGIAGVNWNVKIIPVRVFDVEDDFETISYEIRGLNNLIVVGAMASDDTAAFFTNWGDQVDIAAPGFGILSTYSPIKIDGAQEMYRVLNGTSMAAPRQHIQMQHPDRSRQHFSTARTGTRILSCILMRAT